MLKEITVKGLFGRFNYRVPLCGGDVTVLTGPNGFGKSTLFSLVAAVANRDRKVLFSMPAREFSLAFSDGEEFTFAKAADGGITENGQTVTVDGGITATEERVAVCLGAVKRAGGDRFTAAMLDGEDKLREYRAVRGRNTAYGVLRRPAVRNAGRSVAAHRRAGNFHAYRLAVRARGRRGRNLPFAGRSARYYRHALAADSGRTSRYSGRSRRTVWGVTRFFPT